MKEDFLKAYNDHSDALFRYCFFKVSDREIAKDLLQDTFTKTWSYIARGNKVLNFKAFLYRTLNNLVIDQYREKKNSSLESMREEGFEPATEDLSESAIAKLDGEKAIQLLSKLSDDYKEVLFMRYVQELELSEIADITGDSENAISVRLHRGLNKLKEKYERPN